MCEPLGIMSVCKWQSNNSTDKAMNDSNQKDTTPESFMENHSRRQSRPIKPKSRRQRKRLAEIFFINQANKHGKTIAKAILLGQTMADIAKDENEKGFTQEVIRFTTLQYFERHISGPKSHVRRQIKLKVQRRSSHSVKYRKSLSRLAILDGSQPTGAQSNSQPYTAVQIAWDTGRFGRMGLRT